MKNSALKFDTEDMLSGIDEEIIVEMAKNGVIYGHKKSKTDPNMRPHISVNRQEVEIINPLSVLDSLEKAGEFLKSLADEKKLVLFVGTIASARESIFDFAREFNAPYVTSRWLGGTLTNFKIIRERIDYYRDLKEKKQKGEFDKYTKKERLDFTKEIGKMSEIFEGLLKLERVPDAIFMVDAKEHSTAIREAKRANVPVVAIVDTDDNPKTVDYPIFANDHSKKSITWVIGKLIEQIKGKREETAEPEEKTEDK